MTPSELIMTNKDQERFNVACEYFGRVRILLMARMNFDQLQVEVQVARISGATINDYCLR